MFCYLKRGKERTVVLSLIMLLCFFWKKPLGSTTCRAFYQPCKFSSAISSSRGRSSVISSSVILRLSSSSSSQPKVEISPADHGTHPWKDFTLLDARIQKTLKKEKWTTPTTIQANAIPLLQNGFDVMASSQTGSGKSLMFCLPLLDKLLQQHKTKKNKRPGSPLALIVSPTRELALQTSQVLKILCQPTPFQVSLATGGENLKRQRQQLQTSDILVGTPGRILQFADERQLSLRNSLEYLVIDEADRLLDLGFEPQLTRIARMIRQQPHQSILCSATFPTGVQRMAADFLKPDYYFVSVGRVGSTEKRILQQFEWVDGNNKNYRNGGGGNKNGDKRRQDAVIRHVRTFLNSNKGSQNGAKGGKKTEQSSVLVFSNTKEGADSLGKAFAQQKIKCSVIHGDKMQAARNRALDEFKRGKLQILIATDVAARGLDISSVGLVVQAEAPRSVDTYTHRVGRTGRAGASGQAVTLLDGRSQGIAAGLVDLLTEAGQTDSIPAWLVGMSYVTRARAIDEAELVNAGGGNVLAVDDGDDENAEVNDKFTSQDFRRTAAEGSYGAGRDVSYRSFDDEAYRTDSDSLPSLDVTVESEQSPPGSAIADETAISLDETDTASTSEDSMTTPTPQITFQRPKPSRALTQSIQKISDSAQLGTDPDEQVLRSLSRRGSNQKLRFEYLGLFPFDMVAPFLLTSNDRGGQDTSQDQLPRILMVAEKPSIAKAISDALSGKRGPRQKRGISRALPVYEFTTEAFAPLSAEDGTPSRCIVTVTSVIGHVFSLGFDTDDQRRTDPSEFFRLPVAKQEEASSSKVRVIDHLRALAGKSDHLVLWLDCDPEGENIAHEVIAVARRALDAKSQDGDDSAEKRIHRARFSAITPKALCDAFADLKEPDAALSRSVDARQELDLRVGVAFTRLLTWKTVGLARKKFDPATRVVSYGPCQTPALSFCVDRAREIEKFQPAAYWKVNVEIAAPGGKKKLPLNWVVPEAEAVQNTRNIAIRRRQGEAETSWIDNATFDQALAKQIVNSAKSPGACVVVKKVENKHETMSPPLGLNTVALLEAGSKAMGMSPKQVMNVAEKLYSAGFISYPRTETTKYDPNGFDVRTVLREHSGHELWGKSCSYLLRKKYSKSGRPPTRGRDVGDHPPITPLKSATRQEVGGGAAWRVYEFVTRNFLGSLHNDLSFTRQVVALGLRNTYADPDPEFSFDFVAVESLGFADCCRWVLNDIGASGRCDVQFEPGGEFSISRATMEQDKTRPPKFLQEHELILLMDENRIGTDASMAVHVNNIVDRGYVQLCDQSGVPLRPPRPPRPGQKPLPRQIGRYMVPTALGVELLDLFGDLNEQSKKPVPALLSKPDIRRKMEEEVKQIALGKLDKDECLESNLGWFQDRYEEFSGALTRDRISDFASGLSQTRDTLRYWRRLDAFEETENRAAVPGRKNPKGRAKGGGQGKQRKNQKNGRNQKGRRSGSSSGRAKRGSPRGATVSQRA